MSCVFGTRTWHVNAIFYVFIIDRLRIHLMLINIYLQHADQNWAGRVFINWLCPWSLERETCCKILRLSKREQRWSMKPSDIQNWGTAFTCICIQGSWIRNTQLFSIFSRQYRSAIMYARTFVSIWLGDQLETTLYDIRFRALQGTWSS